MRHFARELFLLARQCGAAELTKDLWNYSSWLAKPARRKAPMAGTSACMPRPLM